MAGPLGAAQPPAAAQAVGQAAPAGGQAAAAQANLDQNQIAAITAIVQAALTPAALQAAVTPAVQAALTPAVLQAAVTPALTPAVLQAAISPVIQVALTPEVLQAAVTPVIRAALAPAVLQAALTPAVLQEAEQENLNAIYPSNIELRIKKYGFGIFIFLPSLLLGIGGTAGGVRLGTLGYRILSQVSWLAPSGLMLAGIGGILFSTVPLWILAAKKCYKIWQDLSKDLSIVSKISFINNLADTRKKHGAQIKLIANKAMKDIKTVYYNSGNWRSIAVLIATKAAQEAKDKYDKE